MKKTILALTTSLFLATGGAAFADSSALDVIGQPDRASSMDLIPSFSINGGAGYTEEDLSASSGFGDRSPMQQSSTGIDMTPTAAIGGSGVLTAEGSAENGFGDYSPAYGTMR